LDVLATRQRNIHDLIRDAVYRQRFSKDQEEIEQHREERVERFGFGH
jgi:hypothetical protein